VTALGCQLGSETSAHLLCHWIQPTVLLFFLVVRPSSVKSLHRQNPFDRVRRLFRRVFVDGAVVTRHLVVGVEDVGERWEWDESKSDSEKRERARGDSERR
jgi:hypothetical protein